MLAKIQKWGNSQGLRLTKNLLSEAGIDVGDAVDISVKDGHITLTPVAIRRGKHNLEDLVARIPDNHETVETDWGPPAGKENW